MRDRGTRPGVQPAEPRSAPASLFAIVVAAALAACNGMIGDPAKTGEASGAQCGSILPGPAPIRRMTRFEYDNTVADLLGDTSHLADGFVPEEEALGFNNQAAALGVTQLLAEQYMEASEKLATNAVAKLSTLLPCDPITVGEDACAKQFIAAFGKKAYRRPLDGSEVDRLATLYSSGKSQWDFATGIQLVIEAMLQSPHFLYRVEFGMPDPVENDVIPLNSYEIASRLSYLLWGSMPDDELFAAADAKTLLDADQIATQARRMLDDPKARRAIANFHDQWLMLSKVDTLTKDTTVYPAYYDGLRPLWKEETQSFLEHVIFDEHGSVADMLTAPYTMMNAELATFYGVANGPSGTDWQKVDLDPMQRAGLLTQASVLAINAKPNQSSPIHRGKFVRERLLCQLLPPPPNNIKIVAPEITPGSTTRERFEQHDKDPYCASCHRLMDPIGLGFEHYDAIGLWRDTDAGQPVDATGDVLQTKDCDGAFDGAIELANKLAGSDQVRQCVATEWFRYGYGRAEQPEDDCNLQKIQSAFAAANFNVKELLVALTQTDAFRFRHAVVAAGGTP